MDQQQIAMLEKTLDQFKAFVIDSVKDMGMYDSEADFLTDAMDVFLEARAEEAFGEGNSQ